MLSDPHIPEALISVFLLERIGDQNLQLRARAAHNQWPRGWHEHVVLLYCYNGRGETRRQVLERESGSEGPNKKEKEKDLKKPYAMRSLEQLSNHLLGICSDQQRLAPAHTRERALPVPLNIRLIAPPPSLPQWHGYRGIHTLSSPLSV